MANMINYFVCGHGNKHPLPPYHGYKLGIDHGDVTSTLVVIKVVPDGGGGSVAVALDVRTRYPKVG